MDDTVLAKGSKESQDNCNTSIMSKNEFERRDKARCDYLKLLDRTHDVEGKQRRCIKLDGNSDSETTGNFPDWCLGTNPDKCPKPNQQLFNKRAQASEGSSNNMRVTLAGKSSENNGMMKTMREKIKKAALKDKEKKRRIR